MSSAKKLELFPEEQYIQDSLRDGTCRLVVEYSMRALGTPDVRLQGRVLHLDMTHVKRLDQALQVNGKLHPVVVFEDRAAGKVYLPEAGLARLADGFHRHEAYRRAGRETIPAYVFVGTFADAAKFAAMCNQVSSLDRTKEDYPKIFAMLLDVEECRKWSLARLAAHVGISPKTALKHRLEYFLARGLGAPTKVETSNGRKRRPISETGSLNIARDTTAKSGMRFSARIGGKKIHLGTNPEAAEARRRMLLSRRDSLRAERWSLSGTNRAAIARSFMARGLLLRGGVCNPSNCSGLWAYTGHGCVVVWTDLATPEALPLHVGIVLAAREHVDPSARAVVVCYHEDAAPAVLELYRRERLGVEFLTPDEFIASVGGTAEESNPPASPDPAAPSAPPP